MNKVTVVLLIAVVAGLLGGCTQGGQAPAPLFSSVVPSPQAPVVSTTPVATMSAIDATVVEPNFRLDPLTADSKEATGQGPKGFLLVIVDATGGAKILGSGKADGNGNFRIKLTQPVPTGRVIGLTVDLTQEQLNSEVLMRKFYEARGPGYRIIPQLLTIFDGYEIPNP